MIVMARQLKAVDGTETPARKKPAGPKRRGPQKITTAAKAGDEKALLMRLRDRIAQAVEDPGTPPRDLSSLSRRLMEITKELKALEVAEAKEAAHVSTQDIAVDFEAI